MSISKEQMAQIVSAFNILRSNQNLGNDCTALLTGSYATGNISKNSDVDLIVISRNVTNKSWGESNINGFKINYSIYPEIQLVSELAVGNTVLCLMVHNSILLCGSNETYSKFKTIVDHIIKKATEPPTDVRRFLMRKKLQNLLDDMEDVKDTDQASLTLLRNNLVDYSLHMFAKESQVLLPNTKHRLDQMRKANNKLYKLIEALLMSKTDTVYQHAQALCAYFGNGGRTAVNAPSDSDWKIEERNLPAKRELNLSSTRSK